jgi:hypothetical protein
MRQLTGLGGPETAQTINCDLVTDIQGTSKRTDNVGPNVLRYLRQCERFTASRHDC